MKYVQTQEALEAVVARLGGVDLVAADTEAAGYHRYHDRICLLQLSTREHTFVIDTLAVTELRALDTFFANPAVEVVLHDADYDLRLLGRDHGVEVRGLFDTKIAAQFLGESGIGYGTLVEKHLGIHLEKKHQRADWAQRPLPQGMLEYAAEDTRHLPALRDRLRSELASKGRLEWAEEEFRHQEQVRWEPGGEDEAYLRIKNTRDLKPRQLAALRALHAWREGVAEERDVAPFRVIGNEVLVATARALPRTQQELEAAAGVPGAIAARRGNELLSAVREALALPESELPVRPRAAARPAFDPEFEQLAERLKGTRDKAADRLELDRGFLMPRHQLESIVRARPRTLEELAAVGDVRRWQVEALGESLLKALKEPA
jgi:ribonuclease D